jgi:uncharacterized membrane protein
MACEEVFVGEVDDFHEFVIQRSPALSRVAYLLTGDHQLAEDLLQSAFARVYPRWRQVREGAVRSLLAAGGVTLIGVGVVGSLFAAIAGLLEILAEAGLVAAA